MSFFSNILKKIFTGKKKVVKHIAIDPQSVKEHNMIRALANENAELKGKLAKNLAAEGREREREQDEEEEKEVRIELDKKKKELRKKEYPKYFSLMAFAKKYNDNKKLRDKLGFYTFDRQKKLYKFGDIGFCDDNSIVLLDDKGQVVTKNESLRKIFQSLGGLGNDIKDGKIPINFDKDGIHVPNIIVEEMYDITPNLDGSLKYTKVRKKPVYKLLDEYRTEISELQGEIEVLEITNNKLNKEIDDLRIAEEVAEDRATTKTADLSKVKEKVSAIGKVFGGMEEELSQMRTLKSIQEEEIEKLMNQLEIMRLEAEREGSKLNFNRALQMVKDIKRDLIRDEPQVKIIEVPQKIVEKPQNPPK